MSGRRPIRKFRPEQCPACKHCDTTMARFQIASPLYCEAPSLQREWAGSVKLGALLGWGSRRPCPEFTPKEADGA
jgi:hypothetical protein